MVRIIAEKDMLELNMPAGRAKDFGIGAVWEFVLLIEHLEATLSSCGRPLQRPSRVGKLLNRLVQHYEISGKYQQLAQAQRARQHVQRAYVIEKSRSPSHESAGDEGR